VRDDLTLSVADVRTEPLPALGPVGTVVTNPPYGRRVDPKGSLTDLHETLGERVRALGPGWRAALVTPHRAHAERTGLPLAPRATTDHGGIRVQLWVGDGA
jgi:23S rRNA G2445 N2-methylase RlmL